MIRRAILVTVLALLPSLAIAQPVPAPTDPSNPAAVPLSPSLDRANQPARGEDSRIARESEVMTGAAPADAESEADRQAREEANKPRPRPRRG